MVVLRLRSPLAAAALGLVLLATLGLALLRVDTAWVARSEVVVTGDWGAAEGEFGRGAGADGRPRGPQAIAADERGTLVVADSLNSRIQIFDPEGCFVAAFRLTGGAAPSQTEDDRAAVYGRLDPCLGWGSGFRPQPDIAAPARPLATPVAGDGQGLLPSGTDSDAQPTGGDPGAQPTGGDSGIQPTAGDQQADRPFSPPYITDLALSGGAWRQEATSGRIDPASGPDIYLLAGWEGAVLAADAAGTLKWTRDLSTPTRFAELRDPYDPLAPVTPESWAGFMLDLDTLHGGGVVVAGYELLPDKLLYFLRALPEVEGDLKDLCAYELVRDGSVKVDDSLPIALEVESVAVGSDGLLYVVAARPEVGEAGGGLPPGGSGAPGSGSPGGGSRATSGASPFVREVWVFTSGGRAKGKLDLDCLTYTRYLRLVGVDGRGLIHARLGGAGSPDCLAVFDGAGRAVLSIPLAGDAGDKAEVADVYLGGDGALYASLATDEGYRVVRYWLGGERRLAWRWVKGG